MYDSELVIRAGALSALKRLCLEAAVWSGVRASGSQHDDGYVSVTCHYLCFGMLCFILLIEFCGHCFQLFHIRRPVENYVLSEL